MGQKMTKPYWSHFFENMPHISKVFYMVYFGNLGLFNDVMGEMGAL